MKPRRLMHRSGLTMPINNQRFINSAWTRGCDGFQLDLQDSVPQAQKAYARTLCQAAIPNVTQGGGDDIAIRINQSYIEADVTAAVWPKLVGLNMGHTRFPEQVRLMDEYIGKMERLRGIRPGTIEIGISPDSVYATVVQEQLGKASPRVRSFGGAAGYDYSLSMGIEMFTGLNPFFYPAGQGTLLSAAHGHGQVGGGGGVNLRPDTGSVSDGDFTYRQAVASRKAGGRYGHGLHPNVVEPMNRGFTPPPEEVEEARQLLEAWRRIDDQGEVEGEWNGRVVDRFEAARAEELIEWAIACTEQDEYKARRTAEAQTRIEAQEHLASTLRGGQPGSA